MIKECEAIAANAKREKNWPAATAALRQVNSSVEMLGRLRGELESGPKVQVGVALQIQQQESALPENLPDLERKMAHEIAVLTENFDPAVIAKLKELATTPQLSVPSCAEPRIGDAML